MDIAAALAKAKIDKCAILLDFGADWCPECATLRRIMRFAVQPELSRFHVVAIDVGRVDRNLHLARRYGLDLTMTGIPALVVLSDSGKVKTAGNKDLYPDADILTAYNVAAFLKRWQ